MSENNNKELAFVFPGQGSQSVGMINDLAVAYPEVKQHFTLASQILGYDLWHLVMDGPSDQLNLTEKTQPALLVCSYAVWQLWLKKGGDRPSIVAGHSLGEYTALLCAEVIDFASAVELVAKRGQLMQQAVPENEGAMAAIVGLDDGRVEEICNKAAENEILDPVNYNSIGQVVIAGNKGAIDRAIVLATDAGAKLAKILQVSVPAHSKLMLNASKKLADELKHIKFMPSRYQVINNVDTKIETNVDAIKDALVRQLYYPVRWVDTILKMTEMGVQRLIECGPGRVLSGLAKRIDRSLLCFPVYDAETLEKALHK